MTLWTHTLRFLTGAATAATAGCESAQFAPGNPGPAPLDPARELAMMRNPSTDVLSVVAWGMAVVLGALVLAFVARLLNGRAKPVPTAPAAKES